MNKKPVYMAPASELYVVHPAKVVCQSNTSIETGNNLEYEWED